MTDDPNKEQHEEEEQEVLHTFDMYHFFSRKDVLLAIVLILVLLGFVLYTMMFAPQTI